MQPTPRPSQFTRRSLLLLGLLSTALAGCSNPSRAGASAVELSVIDRETGQVLEVYQHRGRQYIAGRPGARYAIRISNRSGARILAVTAVDGVNIVSGQTAAWGQTGYVFAPWQSYELTGWRKSDRQVAAFEFTSLPDSYAARTGRPLDVGVIGVAIFRERSKPVVLAPPPALAQRRADGAADRAAGPAEGNEVGSAAAAGSASPAARAAGESSAADASRNASRSRLGTGHGEREHSRVWHTEFDRASTRPDEIITLQYDRFENLVAAGIIASHPHARPRAFPALPENAAYAPDPPRR